MGGKVENGKQKARKHHLRTVRNKTSLKLDLFLLGGILLVAAILRLWKLGQAPFMHDEFSALFRLKFDSFHDLIQYGVKIDGHPAGVQVFLYYWTRIVGWNEFWVKLPFALMGIGSVYLIYVIGKQWFNRKVGLLGAAFFAVSQLTVFYSQIARPYAPGLFFVLFMTYFWNKILFDSKRPSVGSCIGFAITAWLAALAHNFSAAQAGLVFLTGLFFLRKDRREAYWLSGIGALLLYAPNFPIFYHQLFINGGVGGWLARPSYDFLVHFLRYSMNYAPLFMFVMGLVIILPLILRNPERRKRPIRWAAIAWFLIIFALAFVYSLLREPIIQYSTLFFCYPFLVIALLSLYKNNTMNMTQTVVAVLAILFVGSMSLILQRQHYDLMYHQCYDQIALEMEEDNKNLKDICFATYTTSDSYAEFYQAQTDVHDRRIFSTNDQHHLSDFRQWLNEENTSKLGFGWTDYTDPAWETQAVGFYPWQIKSSTWFTSKYLTLSKDSVPGAECMLHPLSREPIVYDQVEWGSAQYLLGDSLDSETDLLGLVATVEAADTVKNCILVMEVHDTETDSILLWHGNSNESGLLIPGNNVIANALRFDPKKFPIQGKTIKTYLWNKEKGTMIVTGFDYYYTKFNSRLTGLYEPL